MTAYASRGTRVVPGDVLGSGTCGNGGCLAELWGRSGERVPPPLEPGDTVTLTVEGIGAVSNTVVPGAAPVPLPAGRRRSRERPPRGEEVSLQGWCQGHHRYAPQPHPAPPYGPVASPP